MPSSQLLRKSVMNHRHGSRHRVRLPVEIQRRGKQTIAGTVYNLSRDGMFVVSEDPPEVNRCVDIVLLAAGTNTRAVCFPSMVIHHSSDGFGVLFRQLGSDARTVVAKCLR